VNKLSHVASSGSVSMVDVSAKALSDRTARAEARVRMNRATCDALARATAPKGDALVTAQIAGVMAAKRTAELIPLAHPLPLAYADVTFEWIEGGLRIEAIARTSAQTGVEMEAMVAATVAALTIYDMAKALDKGIVIESVRLLEKTGGKSGTWSTGDAKPGP
jgi:cyclic pyranopterin phosphate synthase